MGKINWVDCKCNEGLVSAKSALEAEDLVCTDDPEIRKNINYDNAIWKGESSPSGFDALYVKKYNKAVKIFYYSSTRVSTFFIKREDIVKFK